MFSFASAMLSLCASNSILCCQCQPFCYPLLKIWFENNFNPRENKKNPGINTHYGFKICGIFDIGTFHLLPHFNSNNFKKHNTRQVWKYPENRPELIMTFPGQHDLQTWHHSTFSFGVTLKTKFTLTILTLKTHFWGQL